MNNVKVIISSILFFFMSHLVHFCMKELEEERNIFSQIFVLKEEYVFLLSIW